MYPLQLFQSQRHNKLGMLSLALFAPLIIFVISQSALIFTKASSNVIPPMMLISRSVPVFASSEQYPAKDANDANYDTTWRSNGAGWIAYNLSSVPVNQRQKVVLVWYNDANGDYDHKYPTVNGPGYNLPKNYTIEGNAAQTGVSAPASGWVALATVSNNSFHSRQHAIDLTGYNWVRMNVTAVDGSSGNSDVSINLDIHDASQGYEDDYIFFGDSVTAGAMGHETLNGVKSIGELVNAKNGTNFPVAEGGGIGYTLSSDGAAHMKEWLANFPGKYVGLSYGTNDAGGCDTTAFYNNYVTMIQAVLAANKTPIIPHMPWGMTSEIQTCGPKLNAKIDQLYSAYPQIIKGPDLWAYFQANQNLIGDGIHPSTPVGMGAYRQQWGIMLISQLYSGSSPANTPTPTPSNQGGTFSAVHVSAGKIINTQNQPVHLHGVNHSGTEYACIQGWGIFDTPDGKMPNIAAMKSWNINSVMVLINEDCWLGINGVPAAYGGTNYQTAIHDYVNQLLANNIYPVVSMMWTAPGTQKAQDHATMSNMDHTPAAWTSISTMFKGDERVMFRLLQEPHPSAGNSDNGWNCWLKGGANGQNGCNEGFTVAGMQTLLDTVRNTGAKNVVWVSGVDYANSFDQFLTHKPNDPLNNMGASADVYMDQNPCRTASCWDGNYKPIIAAGIPFMAGEFGESVNANICSVTNSNSFMDWMDANGASGYHAWLWNTWGTPCGDLSLITNFEGTAHSPNGTNYKTRLARFASGGPTPTGSIPTNTPVATPTIGATGGKISWSSADYTGWTQNAYPPATLPWNGITHLLQFSLLTKEVMANTTGAVTSSGHSLTDANMKAAVAEAHKRGKKAIIVVGGAEDQNWNNVCTSTNRASFISKMVTIMKNYGYDGIDLDIEQDWGGPDHIDYIACVSGTRNALNAITPRPILMEDGDPDWQGYMLAKVHQYLDQINLMSYWTDANQVVTQLNSYTSLGIPKSLLSIGIGTDETDMVEAKNPAACGLKAQLAVTSGYGGLLVWTVAGDAINHTGQYPCFNAIAPYLSGNGSPVPSVINVPTNTPVPTAASLPTPTPTKKPTPTPTRGVTPTPTKGVTGMNMPLYDNAVLKPFEDGSFGFSSRNVCSSFTYYSTPCSYAIAYQGWGGLNIQLPKGNIRTTNYQSLDWNVNTQNQPITNFSVLFTKASNYDVIVEHVLTTADVKQNLGNGWIHVSIPLSVLNKSDVAINSIQLKNALNKKLSTIYIDDVTLIHK